MRDVASTDDAPAAVGAYSQGTTDGTLLFTAGQLAMTPDGDLLEDAGVGEQTERALSNVFAILESEGAGATDVLKVTVYLRDAADFGAMNDAYAAFFDGFDADPPARSAVEAPPPVDGADVEIEAVASLR